MLEALKGDRQKKQSMRINNQYRICFTWSEHGPDQFEIIDYHQQIEVSYGENTYA
jgi:toxin HigB-1